MVNCAKAGVKLYSSYLCRVIAVEFPVTLSSCIVFLGGLLPKPWGLTHPRCLYLTSSTKLWTYWRCKPTKETPHSQALIEFKKRPCCFQSSPINDWWWMSELPRFMIGLHSVDLIFFFLTLQWNPNYTSIKLVMHTAILILKKIWNKHFIYKRRFSIKDSGGPKIVEYLWGKIQ